MFTMKKVIKAAGTIIERRDGKILLLYRSELWPEGKKWGLVGGKAKKNETPLDNAIREIKEEIHLTIAPSKLKHIGLFRYPWKTSEIHFDVFKYETDKLEEVKLLEEENTDYQWIHPTDALKKKDLMTSLYKILKKRLT